MDQPYTILPAFFALVRDRPDPGLSVLTARCPACDSDDLLRLVTHTRTPLPCDELDELTPDDPNHHWFRLRCTACARAAAGAVPRQRLGRPPRARLPRARGGRAQLPRGLCLYLPALRRAGPPPPEDLLAGLLRLLEVLGRGGERRGVLPALRRARRRGAGRGPVWSLPGAGRGGHRPGRVARPARAAALPPRPPATESHPRRTTSGRTRCDAGQVGAHPGRAPSPILGVR